MVLNVERRARVCEATRAAAATLMACAEANSCLCRQKLKNPPINSLGGLRWKAWWKKWWADVKPTDLLSVIVALLSTGIAVWALLRTNQVGRQQEETSAPIGADGAARRHLLRRARWGAIATETGARQGSSSTLNRGLATR